MTVFEVNIIRPEDSRRGEEGPLSGPIVSSPTCYSCHSLRWRACRTRGGRPHLCHVFRRPLAQKNTNSHHHHHHHLLLFHLLRLVQMAANATSTTTSLIALLLSMVFHSSPPLAVSCSLQHVHPYIHTRRFSLLTRKTDEINNMKSLLG